MDALKLKLHAKDQLHGYVQELVTGFARFKGSKDWEGRSKMVSWYVIMQNIHGPPTNIVSRLITLNGMKASEELTDEQARQLFFDVEHAYQEFLSHLDGGKDDPS